METQTTAPVGKIFEALAAVKDEINKIGVAKERDNTAQGFKYRGIDDALNSFSGPFARAKVLTTPVFETVLRDEVKTRNSSMFRSIVSCVCTFLSLEDGSTITVGPFEGEATDVLDKATTKATSVALRNLLFMTFTVPFGAEEPEQYEGGEVVAGPSSAKPEVAALAGISGLSKSQEALLRRRMEAGRISEPELLEQFGGISPQNLKSALEWIDGDR